MTKGIMDKSFTLMQKSFWPIYLLAAATFFLQLPIFFGEDIINARNNYLTGAKTDFWGGMSTLVYSHIPSIGFRWQIWLALFQILITSIGLIKIIRAGWYNRWNLTIKIVIAYSALIFGSQMTRDGLMFSLLIFGYALLKQKTVSNPSKSALIWPILIITFAMSFRPWMSIAIIPIIFISFLGSKNKPRKIVALGIAIFIAVTPVIMEISTTKILGLKKSYPEQQVMLMDFAASYCYSNNKSSGTIAEQGLRIFTADPNYPKFACQLYRPDTWFSLTQPGNVSSEGIKTDFWLIQAGDSKNYELAKSTWLKLIVSDPVTYLQNKILFTGKLLIGSDSRNINFISSKTYSQKILSIYRIPYDIAISLHLYSIIMCLIVLLLLPFIRFLRSKESRLTIDVLTLLLISALVFWAALSSIAYIASNGRYTYAVTLLSLVIYVSHISKLENSNDASS